jgi:hypothetical protein
MPVYPFDRLNILNGRDALDLRVTLDPDVEKQDAAARGGYFGRFLTESEGRGRFRAPS